MRYYISENGRAAGPFTLDELRQRSIVPATQVWYEGLRDWVRADSIEDIRREILGNAPAPPAPPSPRCPSTYLVPAILLTLCCCNPLAIVAIVYALQVQPAYSRGHYEQAVDASDTARRWCIVAAIAWVAIFIFLKLLSWNILMPLPILSPFDWIF